MPKGRSKELIELRNRKLYKRYKELFSKRGLRYSAIFPILEEEFFIAEGTIMHILRHYVYQEQKESEERPREFSGFRKPLGKRKAPSVAPEAPSLFGDS